MIQFRRASTNGDSEVWYLHAAAQKLYRLGEAHCAFSHPERTAVVSVFMSESCPRHRDLVDYFLDQVVPPDYTFMVSVYSRGIVVEAWNSADNVSRIEGSNSALDLAAAVIAQRLLGA